MSKITTYISPLMRPRVIMIHFIDSRDTSIPMVLTKLFGSTHGPNL